MSQDGGGAYVVGSPVQRVWTGIPYNDRATTETCSIAARGASEQRRAVGDGDGRERDAR